MSKLLHHFSFLCVILFASFAFAGGGDPKPLSEEDARLAKQLLDNEAKGDGNSQGVILTSSEGVSFVVKVGAARFAETLTNLLEDAGTDNPIPLPNITTRTLVTVAACLHRLASGETTEQIREEMLELLSLDELRDVLLGMNYLDIPLLLEDVAWLYAKEFIAQKNETNRIFASREEFEKKYPTHQILRPVLQLLNVAARTKLKTSKEKQADIERIHKSSPELKGFEKDYQSELLQNMTVEERNILLIGRSRAGKTTLAKMIQDIFEVAETGSIFRGTIEPGIIRVDLMHKGVRYRFNFIDTPGLFEYTAKTEKKRTNEELIQLIRNDLISLGRPIHGAIWCFSVGQGINSHDLDAIQYFIPILSSLPWTPVVTHAEGSTPETLESLRSQMRQHPILGSLLGDKTVFFSGALEKYDIDFEITTKRKIGNLNRYRLALLDRMVNLTAPYFVADLNWPLPRVVAERNDNLVIWRNKAKDARIAGSEELPKAPARWFDMCRPKSDQKKCEDEARGVQLILKESVGKLDALLDAYAQLGEKELPDSALEQKIKALIAEIEDQLVQLKQVIPGISSAVEAKKAKDE